MNADDLRAYRKRWEMVAEVERAELGQMSPAQKFADIATLMQVARALGGAEEEDDGAEQVRRRWCLLVERMGG